MKLAMALDEATAVEVGQFEKEKNAWSAAPVLEKLEQTASKSVGSIERVLLLDCSTRPRGVPQAPPRRQYSSVPSAPPRAGVGNSCNASTSTLGLQVNYCKGTESGTSMVRWRYQLALLQEITLLVGWEAQPKAPAHMVSIQASTDLLPRQAGRIRRTKEQKVATWKHAADPATEAGPVLFSNFMSRCSSPSRSQPPTSLSLLTRADDTRSG